MALTTVREKYFQSGSRAAAAQCFLELLEKNKPRIDETKHLIEQIYRFETPDRPVIYFNVERTPDWRFNGKNTFQYDYVKSSWVSSDLDKLLDDNVQRIMFQLERFPEADYVPTLRGGGASIGSMYGVESTPIPGRGGSILKKKVISDLEADLPRIPDIDPANTPQGIKALEIVQFLSEVSEGKIPIVYPGMGGPLNTAASLMGMSEMMMASCTSIGALKELVNHIMANIARMTQAFQKIVDPDMLVPRFRLYQPSWAQAVLVDDFISVVRPEHYFEICADAYRNLSDTAGMIFLHTCGPVIPCADTLAKLPGLAGFETCFINGNSRTTREIGEMKTSLSSNSVLNCFGLPTATDVFNGLVDDPENLTPEWIEEMYEGGGFIFQNCGTPEEGKQLLSALGL